MKVSKFRLSLVAVVGALTFAAAGAGMAYAFQPHMVNARDALHTAQDQLQEATPDKDGHRVAAINLVQQAINQVNLGIQAGAQ